MKTEGRRVGTRGEDAACDYLRNSGHLILERNWRSSHLETDIITLDRSGIHFVEVKTRKAPTSADPEVNVGEAKKKRMVRSAQSYLHSADKARLGEMEVFFDVLTVVLDGDETTINYYPQAFIPTYV